MKLELLGGCLKRTALGLVLVCGLGKAGPGSVASAAPPGREGLPPGLQKKEKLPPGWQKKAGQGQAAATTATNAPGTTGATSPPAPAQAPGAPPSTVPPPATKSPDGSVTKAPEPVKPTVPPPASTPSTPTPPPGATPGVSTSPGKPAGGTASPAPSGTAAGAPAKALTREQRENQARLDKVLGDLETLAARPAASDKLLQRLSNRQNIPMATLQSQLKSHPGLTAPQLYAASIISREGKMPVEQVLQAHKAGSGWGDIARAHKVSVADLTERLRAASDAARR